MKLYNYWRSSSSWRVRLVLAIKGVDYEYIPVHLLKAEQHQPAHRQRNPVGAVPVLELDDGTFLSQSVAIVEYLEDRFSSVPLLPVNPVDRAQVRMMVELVNSGIQPFQNPACTQYVKDTCQADEKAFARHFISAGLEALEKMAAAFSGKCLFGDSLTLADCYLLPQLYAARRFGVDLQPYARLTRIETALASLPTFVQAAPEQQIDAVKQP
jgi:maleylpyruvate isomerase